MDRDAHEQNRRSWNAATVAHNRHKGDQAAFLRSGGSTLFPEEVALLGDLAGLRLLHLQCNAGQDTLSLAGLGARCTGVDISDEAIAFARRLAAAVGRDVDFVRADVLDYLAETDQTFDVVFASYGVLGWISDLGALYSGVARVLRPGGRAVLVEFHPVAFLWDEDGRRTWPYSSGGVALPGEGVPDYVAASEGALGVVADVEAFHNPHPTAEVAWGLGEVLQAMIDAGLAIRVVREWPWSNGWRPWRDAEALPGRRWGAPAGTPALPLMYGVVAR